MAGNERFISTIKDGLAKSARTLGAGVVVSGFSAGFNPAMDVSADLQAVKVESHLVFEKSPFEFGDFELSDLKPDLSTEDADKLVETAFISAYMIGLLAQVRKNLEIAQPEEKYWGWGGAFLQVACASYGVSRIWNADFGNNQVDFDNAAISDFIVGYISTKGALTLRGMSNGLDWTKAIGEAGVGAEAIAGAYAIARVTKVIE